MSDDMQDRIEEESKLITEGQTEATLMVKLNKDLQILDPTKVRSFPHTWQTMLPKRPIFPEDCELEESDDDDDGGIGGAGRNEAEEGKADEAGEIDEEEEKENEGDFDDDSASSGLGPLR